MLRTISVCNQIVIPHVAETGRHSVSCELHCDLAKGAVSARFSHTLMSVRAKTVRFGVFELDLTESVLIKNGRPVKLQEQPFRLLCILLEHPGETVTREN
jgi:DNA-binding response OmpR family regulator